MKFMAGVLTLLFIPPAALRPPAEAPPLAASLSPRGQEWLADPILPVIFQGQEAEAEAGADAAAIPLDSRRVLTQSSPGRQEAPPRAEPPAPESAFPRGVGASEIQAWRQEDDLRRVREWASDATLGAPLLVPQLILEAFLPRGLAVGPTTFFYKTASSASSSLPLVVFDQVLFHEAQFFAQVQSVADSAYAEDLQRGQRRVLRRSLSSGFRATYVLPKMTLEQIFQTADEQGTLGYALMPPVAGALLYLKGLDQRVQLDDDVRVRFRLASGQDFLRGLHSANGNPAFSIELRFCEFPVGIIASFDATSRGMIPSFIGLGTSLDAVEELLSREASTGVPLEAR